MSRLIDTDALDWQPVRPELTHGVSGKLLLDAATRIVLTRVEPGGIFPPHRDAYGHLFHFLSGAGVLTLGDQRKVVGPGISVQIEAGELHGYENNGKEDLLLISVNLAVS
jgi:quercetin dioxygenase-like cupin family protein